MHFYLFKQSADPKWNTQLEGRKYQFGGKCIDFISYYQYSHPTGPKYQKKQISSFVTSTVIQWGLFFYKILKVVVLFERKNWIGFYLKIPSKVGVFYVISPKNNYNNYATVCPNKNNLNTLKTEYIRVITSDEIFHDHESWLTKNNFR